MHYEFIAWSFFHTQLIPLSRRSWSFFHVAGDDTNLKLPHLVWQDENTIHFLLNRIRLRNWNGPAYPFDSGGVLTLETAGRTFVEHGPLGEFAGKGFTVDPALLLESNNVFSVVLQLGIDLCGEPWIEQLGHLRVTCFLEGSLYRRILS